MVSNRNKNITIKVSKDTYNFLKTFSDKYKVSVSSFCQDCITQSILFHDKNAGDNPDSYFRKLSKFINLTYDERCK